MERKYTITIYPNLQSLNEETLEEKNKETYKETSNNHFSWNLDTLRNLIWNFFKKQMVISFLSALFIGVFIGFSFLSLMPIEKKVPLSGGILDKEVSFKIKK